MVLTTLSDAKAQVINAPSRETPLHAKSVFLAGTTSKMDRADWRATLAADLADQPITIFNPFRPDWGAGWKDISCQPYREQIEWELDMHGRADVVVVYFHPVTDAPISMMEFGLCAQTGKAIVCVPQGFRSRPNVLIVCERLNIEIVESITGFREAILSKLGLSAQQ